MINKYAEIKRRLNTYTACRGILRIKLAEDAAASGTTSTDPATTEEPKQYDYGARQATEDFFSNMAEKYTGGTSLNGAARMGANFASNIGNNIYDRASGWMQNSKNPWMKAVGTFMGANKENINNVFGHVAGNLLDQQRAGIRNANINKAMTAQQQAQQQQSFDPNAMFMNMFQNMAGVASQGGSPSQYNQQQLQFYR